MNTLALNTPPSPEIVKNGGELITRAFQDDAVIRYLNFPKLLKDYVERKFFEGEIARSHTFTENSAEEMGGIVIYTIKESTNKGSIESGENMLERFLNLATKGRYRNIVSFFQFMDEVEQREMPERHINISHLAVKADQKGKGIAKRLLEKVVAEGEQNNCPVYLYTIDPQNVRFYEKMGFTQLGSGVHPETGIKYWTFTRKSSAQVKATKNQVEAVIG